MYQAGEGGEKAWPGTIYALTSLKVYFFTIC